MKVLLINGSPKGKRSNSLRLAESFMEGFKNQNESRGSQVEIERLDLASMKIASCKGCFACWKNTPGSCCIKDDMQQVIQKMLESKLIVWSFPLYYFNVPGLLKNLIDRQLPMSLPFMSENESGYGSGSHDARYDMSGVRHVLVSTCGFYSAKGNYDSVTKMFDHFLGRGNYATIFCGQGELFNVPELSERTGQYLETVKKAGCEYADGQISDATQNQLETLLYPKDVFEKLADANWGIDKGTGKKDSADLTFTKQMAALYNKKSYGGKDRVLEMRYTDLGTSYQILLGKDGSEVFTDGSLKTTTCVETPFELWASISRGEIAGAEALAKNLYSVTGDFSLMMDWNKIFGNELSESRETRVSQDEKSSEGKKSVQKNPSMTSMLIPWITFWISLAIDVKTGSLVSLLVCALVPLIMGKHRLIIWDRLSLSAVAILSLVANISGKGDLITNIGYLVFGLFWLVSCCFKEPLCASYVKYSYGGEEAVKNPLFMNANYILAAAWGVLYILTAVWTFFLRKAGFGNLLIVVNNLIPVAMGIFTAWFSKWYPAWKARGKK